MRNLKCALSAIAMLVGSAASASAHVGWSSGFALVNGLAHPFAGADHVAAALAVGLWAAMVGGRARLAWPAVFVALMCLGAVTGAAGHGLPGAELLILASVIGLGAAVALGVTPSLAVGSAVCAVFALAHGFAHGSEIAAGASIAGYVAGLSVATALLHGLGLALGRALRGWLGMRFAGVAIGATGVGLAVA